MFYTGIFFTNFIALLHCPLSFSLSAVTREKVDQVYGREGTDVLLQCSPLKPELSVKPPIFSWTLKGMTSMATVVEKPNGDLEIDDLKIENSGYYRCTITNKDDDGNIQERTFNHKLIVYKVPDHFHHSSFSVRTKASTCGSFTKSAVERQASAAFCPPGEFLVCPFTFESNCQGTKDANYKIISTKMMQRLDLEFKIPECDPGCVYTSITRRMQEIYERGRAKYSEAFLSGPIVPPEKLDEFSKFVYLHAVKDLPMIKWEPRTRDHTIIKCPPGFRSDPDPPVCVPCLPGMFSLQGIRCTSCPTDTYQDGFAKDTCKTCPTGTTSEGRIGLEDKKECIARGDDTAEEGRHERHTRQKRRAYVVSRERDRQLLSHHGKKPKDINKRSLNGKPKTIYQSSNKMRYARQRRHPRKRTQSASKRHSQGMMRKNHRRAAKQSRHMRNCNEQGKGCCNKANAIKKGKGYRRRRQHINGKQTKIKHGKNKKIVMKTVEQRSPGFISTVNQQVKKNQKLHINFPNGRVMLQNGQKIMLRPDSQHPVVLKQQNAFLPISAPQNSFGNSGMMSAPTMAGYIQPRQKRSVKSAKYKKQDAKRASLSSLRAKRLPQQQNAKRAYLGSLRAKRLPQQQSSLYNAFQQPALLYYPNYQYQHPYYLPQRKHAARKRGQHAQGLLGSNGPMIYQNPYSVYQHYVDKMPNSDRKNGLRANVFRKRASQNGKRASHQGIRRNRRRKRSLGLKTSQPTFVNNNDDYVHMTGTRIFNPKLDLIRSIENFFAFSHKILGDFGNLSDFGKPNGDSEKDNSLGAMKETVDFTGNSSGPVAIDFTGNSSEPVTRGNFQSGIRIEVSFADYDIYSLIDDLMSFNGLESKGSEEMEKIMSIPSRTYSVDLDPGAVKFVDGIEANDLPKVKEGFSKSGNRFTDEALGKDDVINEQVVAENNLPVTHRTQENFKNTIHTLQGETHVRSHDALEELQGAAKGQGVLDSESLLNLGIAAMLCSLMCSFTIVLCCFSSADFTAKTKVPIELEVNSSNESGSSEKSIINKNTPCDELSCWPASDIFIVNVPEVHKSSSVANG